MLKFLQWLFPKKEEVTASPVQEKQKHFVLNNFIPEADVRDIDFMSVPKVQAMMQTALAPEYHADDSGMPTFNQGWLGTCVAHALVWAKMLFDKWETGKLTVYSRRLVYSMARKMFGYDNTSDAESSQGLYTVHAGKVLSVIGTIKERPEIEGVGFSHTKYINDFVLTDEMRKEANTYRMGKYAFPTATAYGYKLALNVSKLVPATIYIDWNRIDADGTVHAPVNAVGTHEVVIKAYEIHNGRERFVFKNSWGLNWGTNGDGYIWADEIEKVAPWPFVFLDIPNDMIERAKQMQYIFLKDLKVGMSGEAVLQLQKRLVQYNVRADSTYDSYFGNMTKSALIEWQKLKGLVADGIFGAKSRAVMNADSAVGVSKSKIDMWCQAIEKMEGAKPSLNNPGNLKYVGQASAVGKDYRGFCIFPDYATGYMELRKLLVRACTGQSKYYKPDMTLIEFYHVYAPSSDNNNPNAYAKFVADFVGVSPQISIKELL